MLVHFPRIVTDGLVLCLDAGNPLSYPVGPELWDGTVSPTILNFGGTTGYYDIATKTMHSPTSAAYVDRPRFTFNLGLTAGKLYSIVGMLSGDLDDLTTGGRVNPNITLNTVTGEINTTFTAVNESIWFVFNANFSPSSVTIESLSVREVTSVWKDLSGNSNNGTLVNGVGYNSGNGGSLSFDGVNDYVSSNNVTLNFDNGFTISQWLKVLNISSNLGSFQYRNGSNNINILFLTSGSIRLESYGGGGQLYSSSGSFNLNQWYNLVCTFSGTDTDGGSGISTIYLNGISIASGTRNGFNSTTADIIVGAYSALYFNGYISNNQFYNKSLTPQQILDNYRATKGRYGL